MGRPHLLDGQEILTRAMGMFRTGRFRLGENQMLFDAEGRSRISYEDLAAAVIDEVVLPRHVQRRFTAAY